jgi:trimethylamine--corrinoid protein Co-methyltransferase
VTVRGLRLDGWRHPVLDENGIASVHAATLEVLSRTGVVVRSASVRRELRRVGAVVGDDNGRVRLPADLVDAALAAAPHSYTLAARHPELDLPLDGARGWLSVDGSAAELLDLDSGRRRPSTLADLELVTRLADALPEIGFLWQGVEAGDVPVPVRPLHELRVQLSCSTKHVQLMTAVTPFAAEAAVAMAAAVVGGAGALRERPILSAFQTCNSPLTYDGAAMEAAIVYARAGVPSGFVVMPLACATAPASPAGVLVQSNAEILAGVTILESLVPGAPTFYGACPTVMDLRSGLALCGGPEDVLFQAALAQLGRHYGLPTSIGTFATGARRSDWQAGFENAMSGMASLLGGADMLSGAGLLNGAQTFSLEQLLLDAEMFSAICRFAEGIAIDPDSLATEVIAEVGPGGHFLAERHTVTHMRKLWRATLYDRSPWEEWEAAGSPGAPDRARVRLRSLLEEHHPEALPAATLAELDEIVASREEART